MSFIEKVGQRMTAVTSRQYIVLIVMWSLLLSAIAFYSDPVLNRDGMFYVDIAQSMLVDGPGLRSEKYGWAFLPALLASGSIVGLSPLTSAIVFTTLCGALIPVMMFMLLSRYQPNYRHLAFMIASLLPWASTFRADLLRDSGAWLFMLVALYAAFRWVTSRRFGWSLLLFASAFLAFLFRIEMALLFSLGVYIPLVIRWQLARQGNERFLSGRFVLFVLAVLALMLMVANAGYEYAQVYLNNFLYGGPFGTYAGFLSAISVDANEYLNKDLGSFVFFGFSALVVIKIVGMLGLFSWPVLLSAFNQRYRSVVQVDGGLTLMVAALFILPVAIFIFMNMFVLSRYVMPSVIALSPFVLVGTIALWRDILGRRGRAAFVLIALMITMSSVTSTSAGKQYIRTTGQWLSAQGDELGALMISDERISFYAGRGYVIHYGMSEDDYVPALSAQYQTAVFTFDVKRGGEIAAVEQLMAKTGFEHVLFMDDNGAGKGAVVLSRREGTE